MRVRWFGQSAFLLVGQKTVFVDPFGDMSGAAAVLNIASAWEHAGDDSANIEWARSAWRDMRQFSTGGTYVNFLTQDADEERVRAAYGPELYDRLARIKAKYDPNNLFRSNQNIRPALER